jgi:hypothetical protein
MRDTGITVDSDVIVELASEGPQRGDLPADISAVLEANPAAAVFFDTLAQFYRKAYLRLYRCDDPLARPARGAYSRGSRPARGRDQRTATTVNEQPVTRWRQPAGWPR